MAVYFLRNEAATPSQEPQCAATGFGLRTCNAAMPQMRVSFARVEKSLKPSPNWTNLHVPCRRLGPVDVRLARRGPPGYHPRRTPLRGPKWQENKHKNWRKNPH